MELLITATTTCIVISLLYVLAGSVRKKDYARSVIQIGVGAVSLLWIQYMPDLLISLFQVDSYNTEFSPVIDELNSQMPFVTGMMNTMLAVLTISFLLRTTEPAVSTRNISSVVQTASEDIKPVKEKDSEALKRADCSRCGAIVYKGRLCDWCGQ